MAGLGPGPPPPAGAPQLPVRGRGRGGHRPGLKVQGLFPSAPRTGVARVSNCLTLKMPLQAEGEEALWVFLLYFFFSVVTLLFLAGQVLRCFEGIN